MTTGVLLMTYGAPTGPDDVAAYLMRVRGGTVPSPELVAEFVTRYERIGGSPLVRITKEQAAALGDELGSDYRVEAGMRFSEPTIAQSIVRLVEAGCESLAGICLSPQWSTRLMGGYVRAVEDAVKNFGSELRFRVAEAWYREPLFAAAIAARVRDAMVSYGRDADDVAIILTAHSMPKRVFDAEPEYVEQLKETAQLIVAQAGLAPERWQWAYQSAGHTQEEWLRPDLKELFPALAQAGRKEVLVVPIQFLSDHLEVLYDLDIAAAHEATEAGLRYRRTRMPNTQPLFIKALAQVARGLTITA